MSNAVIGDVLEGRSDRSEKGVEAKVLADLRRRFHGVHSRPIQGKATPNNYEQLTQKSCDLPLQTSARELLRVGQIRHSTRRIGDTAKQAAGVDVRCVSAARVGDRRQCVRAVAGET